MYKIIKQKSILNNTNKKIFSKTNLNAINKTQKKGFFSGGNGSGLVPNFVKYCIYGSIGIYFMGVGMQDGQYIRKFLFNKESFLNGNYHTIITNHFTKTNLFDLIIDCGITYLLSGSIAMVAGEAMITKCIIYGIGISSAILLLQNDRGTYYKCDSILRSIVWLMILRNPMQSFTLLPFPITIKAFYLGIFLAVIDLMSGKYCNFGGAAAAYILTKGKL